MGPARADKEAGPMGPALADKQARPMGPALADREGARAQGEVHAL